MGCRSVLLLVVLVTTSWRLPGQQFEMTDVSHTKWFKGNIHTHTRVGGVGDTSAEDVASWYKSHGYNFLAITDHYAVTLPNNYETIVDSSFVLIKGEETTSYARTADIDVGALGVDTAIPALRGKDVLESLQTAIDAIRNAGGIPVINHPNYNWRLDKSTIEHASNCMLFELFNGGPTTNSFGDDSHPSTEEMWDYLLSAGKRIYGVATDDANHFYSFAPDKWNPGRGWVVARAHGLAEDELLRSLESGLFYATTGIVLEDLNIESDRMEMKIHVEKDHGYLTEFHRNRRHSIISNKGRDSYLSTSSTNRIHTG